MVFYTDLYIEPIDRPLDNYLRIWNCKEYNGEAKYEVELTISDLSELRYDDLDCSYSVPTKYLKYKIDNKQV